MAAPPPVIAGDRVVAFAIFGESVVWTGRLTLFVGDEQLGPTPTAAVVQPLDERPGALAFFCDEEWQPLGVVASDSVEDAKAVVERAYDGVQWVASETTPEQARQWLKEHEEQIVCLFCGREMRQVHAMIRRRLGTICDLCLVEFHEDLQRNT